MVIGLGVSGLATVRFLVERGARVLVTEALERHRIDQDALVLLEELGVTLECGGHTTGCLRDADLLIPGPGVPLDMELVVMARRQGIPVVGELALAADRIGPPVVAVTGSNGKTTVTSLIGHLLEQGGMKVFVGGNIGTPVLEHVRRPGDTQVVVLELSSFQLEIGQGFRPDIGLLLNISADHLERHGSMERYVAAKWKVFAAQTNADAAILGLDDDLVMRGPDLAAGMVFHFGADPSADARVTDRGVSLAAVLGGRRLEEEYDLADTSLASRVNRLNAAAAILPARILGCPPDAVRAGLASFRLPPHRMSVVTEVGGVTYIDDSKGTNPGAVAAALASCGNNVVLIAGGRSKGDDFSMLKEPVARHVKHLVVLGEAAGELTAQLGGLVDVVQAGSMRDAVCRAAKLARPGDTVLLSPACASFDMFASYARRGEVFQDAVNALQQRRDRLGEG